MFWEIRDMVSIAMGKKSIRNCPWPQGYFNIEQEVWRVLITITQRNRRVDALHSLLTLRLSLSSILHVAARKIWKHEKIAYFPIGLLQRLRCHPESNPNVWQNIQRLCNLNSVCFSDLTSGHSFPPSSLFSSTRYLV